MKNNTTVNGLICTLLLSGILFSTLLYSKRSTANENQTNDETPSLEFLEFLGSWEDSEGQWIDPYQLQDANELDKNLDHNLDEDNNSSNSQTPNDSDDKKRTTKDIKNEK